MKSKDYALIGVAIVMGIILSVIVSKFVFAKHNTGQSVEIVPAISSYFQTPDTSYFNSSSIDPTQFINIGNNSNPNPFASTSQPQ